MSSEQGPKPADHDHLLGPLKVQILTRLIECRHGPITWAVGDSWVVYESRNWTVGADEPATEEHVIALLVAAGGVADLWDC